MPKILSLSLLLFGFLALTIITSTQALNSTLEKKILLMSRDNHFSPEMYQTRNGIISHSIDNNQSQYIRIDLQSREATTILDNIVTACEIAAPVFKHLHYHVQTDSLVYFCPQNTSLLIIDQSSYTVQTSIPSKLNGSWPIYRLSTDGQNVAILGMDTLFNENPQSSILVKVDMQTQKIVAEIPFSTRDPVVAFASSKKASYIATNTFQDDSLTTTVYTIVTIGNSYQLSLFSSFRTSTEDIKIITKLFSVGDYVFVNNGQEFAFMYSTGAITQKILTSVKPLTADQNGLFQPLVTSIAESNYLYIISDLASAARYSFVGIDILTKQFGTYADLQVAFGNLTSEDLVFALDSSSRGYFNILDLKTSQTIYTTVAGAPTDFILTNTTYSIVQAQSDTFSLIHVFDKSNDTLIASTPISKNYYYSKEQEIFSFFNKTSSNCSLQHINLTNGSTWLTMGIQCSLCDYSIITVTITQGGPKLVLSSPSGTYLVYEYPALYQFSFPPETPSDTQAFSIQWEPNTRFCVYDANSEKNYVAVTIESYDVSVFVIETKTQIIDVAANNGLFPINATWALALSNDSVTLLMDASNTTRKYTTYGNWNFAGILQDDAGAYYAILSNNGSEALLWNYGGYNAVPGLKNENSKAGSAGFKSYWVADTISPSIGLVRFYNISGSGSGSGSKQEKIIF